MTHHRKSYLVAILSAIFFIIVTGATHARTIEIPFDAANFPAFPAPITNPYWPLLVGSSSSYKAVAEDECEFNKVTVTNDTYYLAEVNVTARVVRDQEWIAEMDDDGNCDSSTAELVEDTLDYYAQDFAGNIWYLGEDTWAWDDEAEECTQEGAWEAGKPVADPEVDPAEAGIVMLSNPASGLRYQQEYLEDEAEDWGAVLRLNASVSIDYGEFNQCLMTKEWTPLEPGEIEHKYYCLNPAGYGLVFIEEQKGKTLYVEFIGANLPAAFPGDGDPNFPAMALGCNGS
jgi:hypothetical protein